MITNGVSKTTNHVKKDARQETELEVNEGGGELGKELKLGEVIWVKTNPSSWWLGQIVDAYTVSGTRIPKKQVVGEVLVRLYGTYTYLYWNPTKYRDELMEALKQNDGSSTKMFEKAMQQEIVYTRSRSLKRKHSDRKVEKAKDGDLSGKNLKQNEEDDIPKQDNSSTEPKVSTRELRARKDKGPSGKLDGTGSAQRDLSLRTRKEIPKNEIPKQDGFRVGTRVLRPRKAQELPSKLEDARRTNTKANSGSLSSGGSKKATSKPEISRQEGKKKGQKADDEGSAQDSPSKLEDSRRSKTKANSGDLSSAGTRRKTFKPEISRQEGENKGQKSDEEGSDKELSGNSPNLSSRRVRVMQSLGIAPPSDSPFKPKRLTLG